jgi:hypothetical protein
MQFPKKSQCHSLQNTIINPKIHIKAWKIPNTQSNPEQKSNAEGIRTPDFKLCYRGIVTKTACYWHKDRQMWSNIIEQKILDKPTQLQSSDFWQRSQKFISEKTQSQQSVLGKTHTFRRLTLELYLSPCTKCSSKWIKVLNVKPESLKWLQ